MEHGEDDAPPRDGRGGTRCRDPGPDRGFEVARGGEKNGTPELVQQAYAAAGDTDAVRSLGPQQTLEAGIDWILAQ